MATSRKTARISKLHYIYNILLLALPAVLFFSYYPVITLGGDQTMNFELSLPLIWLVIFNLVGLTIFCQNRPAIRFAKIWVWLIFPVFLTFSVIWSPNPTRGVLTAGVFWLIWLAIFNFFILRKKVRFLENFVQLFWRVFFASSLLICAWCWVQCMLDLAGLPQSATLMCDGCVALNFGFPHPDGFAIEPQFMGNLLLGPTILAAWFGFDFKVADRNLRLRRLMVSPFRSRLLGYFTFFTLAATLFLTFSRGAIYAFLGAMVVLTGWRIVQVKNAKPSMYWLGIVLAFLFTLNAQGVMAAVGPTNDTYQNGVSKVIHQLSLGLIDFRPAEIADLDSSSIGTSLANLAESSAESSDSGKSFDDEVNTDSNASSIFTGYVAESTDTRLRLTNSALEVWRSSPKNMIFGVGLGGAGRALYEAGLSPGQKEIVQNQYASLLLETGLAGCLLAVFTLYLIARYFKQSSLCSPLFILAIAYGISLCFFSGLPNALQIYLLPPLLMLAAKV